MSTRVVVTCDRCSRDFDAPIPPEPVIHQVNLIQGMNGDETLIHGDLCPRCAQNFEHWFECPTERSAE